jgi:hypothetical protein
VTETLIEKLIALSPPVTTVEGAALMFLLFVAANAGAAVRSPSAAAMIAIFRMREL